MNEPNIAESRSRFTESLRRFIRTAHIWRCSPEQNGKDGKRMATNANEPSYPDAPHSATFQTGLQFQDFVVMKLAEQHVVLQNLGSKLYQIQVGENLQGF